MFFLFSLLGSLGHLSVSKGHPFLSTTYIKRMCASTFYVTKTLKAQGHNDKRIPQEVSENPITRIKEKKQMG